MVWIVFRQRFLVCLGMLVLAVSAYGKDRAFRDSPITLGNGKFSVCFNQLTGELVEICASEVVLVKNQMPKSGSPWEVVLVVEGQEARIDALSAGKFWYEKSQQELVLYWQEIAGMPDSSTVSVKVGLLPDSAMSSWHISFDGIQKENLRNVVFPRLAGLTDFGDEELAVPDWMGTLIRSPRDELAALKNTGGRLAWSYPGLMSMQFLALYGSNQTGLYFACDDSLAYTKDFALSLDESIQLVYGVDNLPAPDGASSGYTPVYGFSVGFLSGDWLTAAQLYKTWAERQRWCRESRFRNGKVPDWVENTGFWVWNRGRANHVLSPAQDFSRRLGMPVSVLWHWWHNGSYDDSFPEYFPPRDGVERFVHQIDDAKYHNVNALVYMNALKWGPSTKSWQDEGAARYAVKHQDGSLSSYVYNIFTDKALANMCLATDFWKSKYASLVDTAVNLLNVSGVYMDQACISRICYDPSHGHPIGGGNYWVSHAAKLDRLIRNKFPEAGVRALAGEGAGENWLPYLDLFLVLQVSKERYTGIHPWQTIPLFQAVYHEYGITFGNYSSLLSPPYDEMWPSEFLPPDAETPLDTAFNEQFMMEQARSFVWGMQPMIANYQPFLDTIRPREIDCITRMAHVRQLGKKYFLYGTLVRPPVLVSPEAVLDISKLSIYAGRQEKVTAFKKAYPLIYTGAWKAPDGCLAIALASISSNREMVEFELSIAEYGIGRGEVFIVNGVSRKRIGAYGGDTSKQELLMEPNEVCFIEFIPSRLITDQSIANDGSAKVIAHRGGTMKRPENTLSAYKNAVESGADMVEIDVRISSDGKLFILHDASVDRTTNGEGLAADLTMKELKALDAGSWFDPRYSGERIPSFQDVLVWAKAEGVVLLLDLKQLEETYSRRVAAEVNQYGAAENVVVGVRSADQAKLFRKLLPASRQLGFIPSPDDIEAYAAAEVDVIRLWLRWLENEPSLADRVRATGTQLMVNGTVGGLEEANVLMGFSPDWILIDDPAQLVESLNKVIK